ncbi:MAG: hypothetical protein V3V08_23395 [Nannocystaceae bacterium]
MRAFEPDSNRGHTWQTYGDLEPCDDTDSTIHPFGYDEPPYHNGPVCTTCGYGYCWHCHSEGPPEPCQGKPPTKEGQPIAGPPPVLCYLALYD